MHLRITIIALFLLLCSLIISSADACRYNVRDVGFVEFGEAPYHLYVFIDNQTPDDITETFRQIVYAALLESNIELTIVNIDEEADHPALSYIKQKPMPALPFVILTSEKNSPLPIAIKSGEKSFKDNLWQTIDQVVSSPLRERIVDDAIEHYGVLLLFEGVDKKNNQQSRQIANTIIEQVDKNLISLPKEIKKPPVLHIVKREDFAKEQVLMWALGVETDYQEPQAAVVYGRARMIGSLLKGEEITSFALGHIVTTIGESCECGLERSWMMGTIIPFRWTNSYREKMAEHLGFDPDNPFVKTEISQILSTSASGRVQTGQGGNSTDLLMGYSEISLDYNTSDVEQDQMENASPITDITPDINTRTIEDQETTPDIKTVVTSEAMEPIPSHKSVTVSLLISFIVLFVVVSLFGGIILLMRLRR